MLTLTERHGRTEEIQRVCVCGSVLSVFGGAHRREDGLLTVSSQALMK